MTDELLTPWFDGKVEKPARSGVYMQMNGYGNMEGYQYWDGAFWHSWCYSVEFADRSRKRSDRASSQFQNDNWRGLARKG